MTLRKAIWLLTETAFDLCYVGILFGIWCWMLWFDPDGIYESRWQYRAKE